MRLEKHKTNYGGLYFECVKRYEIEGFFYGKHYKNYKNNHTIIGYSSHTIIGYSSHNKSDIKKFYI